MAERTIEATFCFVDVSGFTALTEAHGDVAAADLIERFGELVNEALSDGGNLVDAIGDAVLVSFEEPGAAVAFVSRLFGAAARESDFPALRAGLHHGSVVERGGRLFGAALNLAARVAAQAHGGQVVATEGVATAVREDCVEVAPLGVFTLRNVRDSVELFSLNCTKAASEEVLDPVCRMRVSPDRAPGRLRHEEMDYWFCSLACAAKFATDPEPYTREDKR